MNAHHSLSIMAGRPWEKTMKNLHLLQKKGFLTDCHIVGNDFNTVKSAYQAHSVILAASTNYFCEQFVAKKPDEGELMVIEELSSECIKVGIDFVYGTVPTDWSGLQLLQEFGEQLDYQMATEYVSSVRDEYGVSTDTNPNVRKTNRIRRKKQFDEYVVTPDRGSVQIKREKPDPSYEKPVKRVKTEPVDPEPIKPARKYNKQPVPQANPLFLLKANMGSEVAEVGDDRKISKECDDGEIADDSIVVLKTKTERENAAEVGDEQGKVSDDKAAEESTVGDGAGDGNEDEIVLQECGDDDDVQELASTIPNFSQFEIQKDGGVTLVDEKLTSTPRVLLDSQEVSDIIDGNDTEDFGSRKFILKATFDQSESDGLAPPRKYRKKKIPCPLCSVRYPTLHGLKLHLFRHHEILNCIYCDYSPLDDEDQEVDDEVVCKRLVAKHVVQHLVENPELIQEPKGPKRRTISLNTIKQEPQQLLCDICSKTFKNSKNFIKHKIRCNESVLLEKAKCNVCNAKGKYLKNEDLLDHLQTKHENHRFFLCTICGESARNELTMVQHFKDHHDIDTSYAHLKYIKAIVTRLNLAEYMKVIFKVQQDKLHEQSTIYETLFVCLRCKTPHTTMQSLTLDLQEHVESTDFEIRPYITYQYECHFCGEMSTNRKANNLHMIEVHRDSHAKTFMCHICNASFFESSVLKDHMLRHSDMMKHICNACGKQFRYTQSFRRHMKVVHPEGDNRIYCELCEFSTANMRTMEGHMNRHKAHKPYQCDLCDKSYATKMQLRKHQSVKHQGEIIHAINITDVNSIEEEITYTV